MEYQEKFKSDPVAQTSKINVRDISDIKESNLDIAGRDIRETRLSAGATYIEKVEIITAGISDLTEVLRQPSVKQAFQEPSVQTTAIGYKTDFSDIATQIGELNHLKRLHDAFHKLEPEYERIRDALESMPGDNRAWERIIRHRYFLETKIKSLLSTAEGVTFSEDVLMVQQFEKIIQEIDLKFYPNPMANSEAPKNHLEAAIYILRTAIATHPKTIDNSLYNVARSLDLDKIVKDLVNLQKIISTRDEELESSTYFQQALAEITHLAQDLRNLSEIHNSLQSIVHELYRIEANLNLKELAMSWIYLDGMNDNLIADNSADWVDTLLKTKTQLAQSIASHQEWEAKSDFWAYQSQIYNNFQDVDDELLDLTNELGNIGRALEGLLGFLGDLI